ncbi:MAG: hypothetical protein JNK49_02250 [Planctomycetes bacterium]|nr:hypothetical protein [Planctomycetota bacterium]
MSRLGTHVLPFLLLGTVLAVVGSAVGYSVFAAQDTDTGPFAVVWDKAACAACGMHVGEPRFAAQLTTADGRQHAFDDPGCLFLYLAESQRAVRSVYLRHHREERWIPLAEVGFVPADKTPMGFGFAAVDARERSALDADEVRRKVLEQTSGHGSGR